MIVPDAGRLTEVGNRELALAWQYPERIGTSPIPDLADAISRPIIRMQIEKLEIPDVLVLKPHYFQDARGYFVETYNLRAAQAAGIAAAFIQDNQAFSLKRGTMRALHFQVPPHAQAKLVRVLRGAIYDVAVDLRADSPTYGHWVGTTLTARDGKQVFVPRGFAHGYCTLEADTEVAYKVDEYYAPDCEQGLIWSDPTLAIDWPVAASDAVLSDRDRKLPLFAAFNSPFHYGQTR